MGAVAQNWGQFRSNGDVTMEPTATIRHVSTMVYTGLFGANSNGNTITGHYQLGPGHL